MSKPDLLASLRTYFCGLARQIIALSDAAVLDHPTLLGSHREALIHAYLKQVLPQRYFIGSGMVYSANSPPSTQQDVIIYDAVNYPMLPHADGDEHAMFIEGVKGVIEVKTDFDSEDIAKKCISVNKLLTHELQFNRSLPARVLAQEKKLEMLLSNRNFISLGDFRITPSRPLTAAIAIAGGARAKASYAHDMVRDGKIARIDDEWPNLLLLLKPGKVFHSRIRAGTNYAEGHAQGEIALYNAGEDALLVFTTILLEQLGSRTPDISDPKFLTKTVEPLLKELNVQISDVFDWRNAAPWARVDFTMT